MVMSGSAERIVFVHDRPGQESLLTGGTIARLRSHGAEVLVLFGAAADDDDADADAVRSAMAALDVSDWRMLPAASAAASPSGHHQQALAEAVADALGEMQATALVIGAEDEGLRAAAAGAAASLGVPVFVSRRVTDAVGQRIVAIDVSDQVDQKLRAIAAYPHRWSVTGRTVEPVDADHPAHSTDRSVTIGGTETYQSHPAAHAPAAEATAGFLGRALAAGVAFLTGAAFGVLGTIAHQAPLTLGPVTVPIGLVLALAGVTALLAGLRLVLGDRMIVFSCAIGLLGAIFILSLRSTGGSVLVPEGLPGTVWTVGPALVAAIVLAWPRIPARPGTA
jgi:LmbE family N-acetylglucosaminyl deacetylase